MRYKSSSDFLRRLNNLFNGLLAIPLLLIGFGYLEITEGTWQALMATDKALLGGLMVAIAAIFTYLSTKFKKESRKITVFATIQDKMDNYYMLANFYYWSAFGLAIITAVMLFITAKVQFTLVYAYMLFWMSLFRPTLRSLADLFDLKDEERRIFMNKEPFPGGPK